MTRQWTIQQLKARMRKASQDPVVFAKNWLKPLFPKAELKGLSPNSLDDWEMDALRCTDPRQIWNCSRQIGKSTIIMMLLLWKAWVYPDSLHLLFASQDQVNEDMGKLKGYISNLNYNFSEDDQLKDYQFEPTKENTEEIAFPNRSRIVARATGKPDKAVRGFSAPDTIVVDEAAMQEDAVFIALNPMLLSNPQSQLILASTPKKLSGFFWHEYTTSMEGDIFKVMRNGVASKWQYKTNHYTVFKVPWFFSSVMDKKDIEYSRMRYGDLYVRQELECEFVADTYSYFGDPSTAIGKYSLADTEEVPSFQSYLEEIRVK